MPIDSKIAPDSGYVKAGRLGMDMSPTANKSKLKRSGGLAKDDNSLIKNAPAESGMDVSKKSVFTMDSDMGLKKDAGKSGKY